MRHVSSDIDVEAILYAHMADTVQKVKETPNIFDPGTTTCPIGYDRHVGCGADVART